jgi:hypothetical protein
MQRKLFRTEQRALVIANRLDERLSRSPRWDEVPQLPIARCAAGISSH